MGLGKYFSLKTTVDVHNDPPDKVVAAFAEYERRTGRIPRPNESLSWNDDGTIDKAPLI